MKGWSAVAAFRRVVVTGMLAASFFPLRADAQNQQQPLQVPSVSRFYKQNSAGLLPGYCRQDITEQLFTREEIQHWNALLGGGFEHIHHYCRGLNWTNQALYFAPNRQKRLEFLGNANGEFDYILYRTPQKGARLQPELLTKKGENLIMLGKFPEALPLLFGAIQLKPDYWPPYVAISDGYKEIGDVAKAREWLEKGLAAVPENKTLKLRMAELAKAKSKPAVAATEEKAEKEHGAAPPEQPASK